MRDIQNTLLHTGTVELEYFTNQCDVVIVKQSRIDAVVLYMVTLQVFVPPTKCLYVIFELQRCGGNISEVTRLKND